MFLTLAVPATSERFCYSAGTDVNAAACLPGGFRQQTTGPAALPHCRCAPTFSARGAFLAGQIILPAPPSCPVTTGRIFVVCYSCSMVVYDALDYGYTRLDEHAHTRALARAYHRCSISTSLPSLTFRAAPARAAVCRARSGLFARCAVTNTLAPTRAGGRSITPFRGIASIRTYNALRLLPSCSVLRLPPRASSFLTLTAQNSAVPRNLTVRAAHMPSRTWNDLAHAAKPALALSPSSPPPRWEVAMPHPMHCHHAPHPLTYSFLWDTPTILPHRQTNLLLATMGTLTVDMTSHTTGSSKTARMTPHVRTGLKPRGRGQPPPRCWRLWPARLLPSCLPGSDVDGWATP